MPIHVEWLNGFEFTDLLLQNGQKTDDAQRLTKGGIPMLAQSSILNTVQPSVNTTSAVASSRHYFEVGKIGSEDSVFYKRT
jgi:hypothetical protein